MSRLLVLFLLLASGLALAANREDIFRRFDHTQHERALARAKVSCVTCHQVGARSDGLSESQLAEIWLEVPPSACHECHAPGEGDLGSGNGVAKATRACAACHAYVPAPVSHVAGWVQHHGNEAATNAASCRDCHSGATCVDCHDRRENAGHKVHDPAWLTVHGIAARTNPASCDSCHVKAECTSCHNSGAGFGRSP